MAQAESAAQAPPKIRRAGAVRDRAASFMSFGVLCSHRNAERVVYALGCNGGNYQNWKRDGLTLRNVPPVSAWTATPTATSTPVAERWRLPNWEIRGMTRSMSQGKAGSNAERKVYACSGGNYNWR